jgi:hypothetical protein
MLINVLSGIGGICLGLVIAAAVLWTLGKRRKE